MVSTIDRSAYDTFVRQCESRRQNAATIFNEMVDGAPMDAARLSELTMTIHDVVGDARFLELLELSETALELVKVLEACKARAIDATRRLELSSWVDQLFEGAALWASNLGDVGQVEIIRRLRQQLRRDLSLPFLEQGASPLGSGRVLLLDDSEVVRYLLESHLENNGYTAVGCATYEELEGRLDNNFDPDMILLDINMPVLQGDEVCRRLRKRHDTRHLMIVLMSSLSDDELEQLARTSGANGYLSKQHGVEELTGYLDRLLDRLMRGEQTAQARNPRSDREVTKERHPERESDGGLSPKGSATSIEEALAAAAAEALGSDSES
jgi:CheY-like chemotaxis protein